MNRVVSFPCGGRGSSSTVPYLVPTPCGAHDTTGEVPASGTSSARVAGRRRRQQHSSSSAVVTPDNDDSKSGVLANRKAYSWVTGVGGGGRRGGGLVGHDPRGFVESPGGGLAGRNSGGASEERTASELDPEGADAGVERRPSSELSVRHTREGASAGNVGGLSGTDLDRHRETGLEVAHRSPNSGALVYPPLSRIRGGGPGGHPWFTGYSDTEEEEGGDEEGPHSDTEYDSDSEDVEGSSEKEGDGVEADEEDNSENGGLFSPFLLDIGVPSPSCSSFHWQVVRGCGEYVNLQNRPANYTRVFGSTGRTFCVTRDMGLEKQGLQMDSIAFVLNWMQCFHTRFGLRNESG